MNIAQETLSNNRPKKSVFLYFRSDKGKSTPQKREQESERIHGFVMLIVSIPTFAGGLLTNTTQHVAFLRMLARGASIDIDGVYSNPAGLAFLPGDGLYLSLNKRCSFGRFLFCRV